MVDISPLKQDLLQNCTNNTKVCPLSHTDLVPIHKGKHVSCCLPCMSFCLWHVIYIMHTWHNPEPKLKCRIAVPDTPCHGRSECLDRHRLCSPPLSLSVALPENNTSLLNQVGSLHAVWFKFSKHSAASWDWDQRLWKQILGVVESLTRSLGRWVLLMIWKRQNVGFCKQSRSYTTCLFRLIYANAISKRSATNKESQAVKRRLDDSILFWCCLIDQVGGAFCQHKGPNKVLETSIDLHLPKSNSRYRKCRRSTLLGVYVGECCDFLLRFKAVRYVFVSGCLWNVTCLGLLAFFLCMNYVY